MEEIWRDIKGYEGLYQVSNLGRVKSLERDYISANGGIRHIDEHYLKQAKTEKGYLRVTLLKNGKRSSKQVHRIVGEAFISNPDNKPQIDHINGDKTLNIVSNLRWATNRENCLNPNTLCKNHHLHTDEWKQKMSAIRKGKSPTRQCIETAQKLHFKKVEQYDKNGCLIKTFDSLTEASTSLGVTISAITNSIKRNGTCCGYYWKLPISASHLIIKH